jgi:hypothetical protein
MARGSEGSSPKEDPTGTSAHAGSTPASSTGIRLITVSYDPTEGIEVDWDGMNAYEAWAYLSWAIVAVEEFINADVDDDDD